MRLARRIGSSLLSVIVSEAADALPLSQAEAVQEAKALILSGREADARALLQSMEIRYRSSNDIDFLLGLLAINSRDYDVAIGHFRAMLVRQPDAVRVRLELGRAFYLKRDYDNAFRQFQFARAGRLPRGVAATIDHYLAAIRKNKSWSYNFSVALAPDSNINSGTSAREVQLFGLPFEIGEESRKRSGTGLAIDAGAEVAPRITSDMRLRLGGALQRREYDGEDFDDTIIAFYAGPRLVLGRWDLSATATGFRRRLGGRRLADGLGGKFDGTYYRDPRTALFLSLSGQRISYRDYPLQTGAAYSAWAGFIRALTPASSANLRFGLSRKTARAPELASWSKSLSVGYYRDFAGGFTLYAEPGFTFSRYDAPDPFFGKRRKDRLFELHLSLLNRRLVMQGFTPRAAITLIHRDSSIDLYDLGQRRVELGFTRSF